MFYAVYPNERSVKEKKIKVSKQSMKFISSSNSL